MQDFPQYSSILSNQKQYVFIFRVNREMSKEGGAPERTIINLELANTKQSWSFSSLEDAFAQIQNTLSEA